jgi:hypothetical protein
MADGSLDRASKMRGDDGAEFLYDTAVRDGVTGQLVPLRLHFDLSHRSHMEAIERLFKRETGLAPPPVEPLPPRSP